VVGNWAVSGFKHVPARLLDAGTFVGPRPCSLRYPRNVLRRRNGLFDLCLRLVPLARLALLAPPAAADNARKTTKQPGYAVAKPVVFQAGQRHQSTKSLRRPRSRARAHHVLPPRGRHRCLARCGRRPSLSARLSVVGARALVTHWAPSVAVGCVAPGVGVRGRGDTHPN